MSSTSRRLAGVVGGAGTTDNRLHLGVSKPQFGAMYGYHGHQARCRGDFGDVGRLI
jgi:hypothetical protein